MRTRAENESPSSLFSVCPFRSFRFLLEKTNSSIGSILRLRVHRLIRRLRGTRLVRGLSIFARLGVLYFDTATLVFLLLLRKWYGYFEDAVLEARPHLLWVYTVGQWHCAIETAVTAFAPLVTLLSTGKFMLALALND
jgi:hypothetical protein